MRLFVRVTSLMMTMGIEIPLEWGSVMILYDGQMNNTQMGSPSTYGNKSDSSEHEGGDPHLLTLEEEVILVADCLRAIQGEPRMNQGESQSMN
jgi:hypothetical protein